MIPYDLIIPSASRPHLLEPVLRSLLTHVDQPPARVLVHDDAAFKGRQAIVEELVRTIAAEHGLPVVFGANDPPLLHGPSLHWLLQQVQTKYFLYSQDDHVVKRALPIAQCLATMDRHQLHHVRFNKRATMEYKGEFQKKEVTFDGVTMCISDHWYFQTHLGRTERLAVVCKWWTENSGAFHEHMEVKVNKTFNGQEPQATSDLRLDVPTIGRRKEIDPDRGYRMPGDDPMDPAVRHKFQKTYIWGKIGEDRYVEHIGGAYEDWSLRRARGGFGGPKDSQWVEGRQIRA